MAIRKIVWISSMCILLLSPTHSCSSSNYGGWHTGLGIGYIKIKDDKDKNNNSKDNNKINLDGSILLNPCFGYKFGLNQFFVDVAAGLIFTPNMVVKSQYTTEDTNEKSSKLQSKWGADTKIKLGLGVKSFNIYGLVSFSAQKWIYNVQNDVKSEKTSNIKKKVKIPRPAFGIGISKVCCDHLSVGVDVTYGNKLSHNQKDIAENSTSVFDKIKTKNYTISANLEFKL